MSTPEKEFALLIAASRTDALSAGRGLLEEKMQGISWNTFLQLVVNHNVLPLVYNSLCKGNFEGIPPEATSLLKRSFMLTGAFNLALVNNIISLKRLFEEEQIRLLPFKGPVLAQMAYQNLGLRACTDLDFFIPARDFVRMEKILLDNGFHRAGHLSTVDGYRRTIFLYLSGQAAFVRSDALPLDVHLSLMPPGYRIADDFDDFYERRVSLSIGQHQIDTFEPEDQLLILCFHGIKNRWMALKHVCDIAELIRAYPDLNWDTVFRRASRSSAERILKLGLYISNSLLSPPIPEPYLRDLERDSTLMSIGDDMIDVLKRSHEYELSPRQRFRFFLSVQESLAMKGRYCLYALGRRLNASWLSADE